MRNLRALVIGLALAAPAAAAWPAAVVQAAATCSGLGSTSFTAALAAEHGGASVTVNGQSSDITGLTTYASGGTLFFANSSGQVDGSVSKAFSSSSSTSTGPVTAPANAYSGHVLVCLKGDSYGPVDAGVYTFDPEIASVSPAATEEGGTVTVTGNFAILNGQFPAVSVNGCALGIAGNEAQLQFKMPGPADGCSGGVSLTETAGDGARLSASGGSVTVVPAVGGVSCASPCYPGAAVSVSGSGFGSHGGWSLGGASGSYSGSDGSFSFPAPGSSEGGQLTVTNDLGQSAQPAGSVTVLPHITGIGTVHENATVTVSGQAFGPAGTVALGGDQGPQPDAASVSWSNSQVQFTLPAGGSQQLTLTRNDGQQANADLAIVPTVDSVSPASAAPGAYLTIGGTGFGQNGSVTIGGRTAQIADWADTAIIAVVPSGAATGKLVVTNAGGQSVAWGHSFTVLGGGSSTGSGGTTYTNSGTMNVKPNYGFLPLPKAPPGVAFHLTAPTDSVKPGASLGLTVSLEINGKAVPGATITFGVASSPGSDTALSAPSALTDQNGVAHVTLKTSRKPGSTVVIAHSGAFADQIRVLTLTPTAALGGVTTLLRTTSTLDPHLLYPFIGALVLAILLLLGTVILQFVLHRRQRVPAPAGPAEAAPVAAAGKPARPRQPRSRKPPVDPKPVALDLAAGAEDIAEVIPLPAAQPRIQRTRTRPGTRD